MALYRKYRPQSFADVVGQDHIVTTLENASKQDKLAHAFLFAGSRGTGKTSVARILAKELMTKDIKDAKLKEQIEKGVEEGTITDLMEIDGASNRGIDDIRDLIEKIQFSPVVASAKVYIIDEVHMLTKEAFNALLKTLEEPPAYAYFILATTELNKIPPTIQSRCQSFPFKQIREEDIIRRLQFIADQEHITIDREALRVIAHHVQGGMRDAVSFLDQLRSLEKITKEDVEQRLGGGSHEYAEAIFQALDTKDTTLILGTINAVEERGFPIDLFIRELLGTVRSMLHEAIETKTSTAAVAALLDTLLRALRDVRGAPVPGLVLEAALLSLMNNDASPEKSFGSFSRPEVKPKSEKPVEEKPKKEPKKEEAKKEEVTEEEKEAPSAAIVEAPDITLENLKLAWPEIVSQATPASVKMSLKDGRIDRLEDKKVVVSFSSTFHRDKVADTDASRTVEEIMEKIFKRSLRLECTLGEKAGDHTPDEDAVNLAEAAGEIF